MILLTLKYKDSEIDIKVNESQRIITTLKVLSDTINKFKDISLEKKAKVFFSGKSIDINKTYAEQNIYNGEKIEIGQM